MRKKVNKVCFTAMFAAMIFALTMLHIPTGISGYIHVGDAMIYIVGSILGGPYAVLAASLGCALADIVSGCPIYVIPTIIIKALIVLPFVLTYKKEEKILTCKSALFTILSGVISIFGYCLTDVILFGMGSLLPDIVGNLVQSVGSAILFVVLALALDKIKIKNKLLKQM